MAAVYSHEQGQQIVNEVNYPYLPLPSCNFVLDNIVPADLRLPLLPMYDGEEWVTFSCDEEEPVNEGTLFDLSLNKYQ
jgi:hypothetical protein